MDLHQKTIEGLVSSPVKDVLLPLIAVIACRDVITRIIKLYNAPKCNMFKSGLNQREVFNIILGLLLFLALLSGCEARGITVFLL